MKINDRGPRAEGSAMVAALIFTVIGLILIGSYLALSSNDARISRLALDYQKATIVAEAGLDYGVMRLKDIIFQYQLSPLISQSTLQSLIDTIPPPPAIGDYAYVTPSGESAFRIQIESDVISGTITNGTSCRGSHGDFQYFSVTCGCINENSGHGAVVKQIVQAVGLYLIRFGVFYEDDLEILPGPTMEFFGPVHCNSDIYLGGPLNFYDRLTSHGNIYHRRKDNGERPGEAKIVDEFNNLQSMIVDGEYLDSGHPDWVADSLQRWGGNVLSSAHGVAELSPPIDPMDDAHDIIEQPLATNHPAYNPNTEKEKFANDACLRIHVDSNGVFSATDYYTNDVTSYFSNATLVADGTYDGKPTYAKNADGTYQMATNGAYDVTQTDFYDQREQCYMAPVDIYIDELQQCFPDLYNGIYTGDEGKGIVYITRDDPDGVSNGVMPCVRLRNGNSITPVVGLSFVSDLPVYVEGDYNTTGDTKPSLVAGDAVTMLSENWQDARSTTANCDSRTAVNTEYNTVIMTGNSETTWGNYNGGLENVLRFLEKWSGKTVKYRGSIIDLWYAEVAQGDWSYGTYYKAPNRDWGYDDIYLSQSPPGMTRVFGMEEILWTRTTWADEGW